MGSDSESWVIRKGEQRSISIKSGEREWGRVKGRKKKERGEQKRGKRETQVVRCEDKTREKRGRQADEEAEAGEARWKERGSRVGEGAWRSQALESFLHQTFAQQTDTVQLCFFLFLIDIFESVPA